MQGGGKIKDISIYCFIIIFCIFTVATTSMGIECYNGNKNFKDKKKHNYSFMVANLIIAIVVMLSLFGLIYVRIKARI